MAAKQEIIIEKENFGILSRLVAVWQHRSLLWYFIVRTVRLRYKETIMGWLWLIIRPLVPAIISTVIFGGLAGMPSEGIPYFIFFFTGMSLWSFFATSLIFITRSLRSNRRLITKLYFPRLIVPISSIAPFFIEFLIYLAVLAVAFVAYYIKDGTLYLNLSANLIFSVLFVILATFLALGIGLWTSVLNAQARDVRLTLPYVLQLWFFVTPIIYPFSLVPEKWRWLTLLNPMTTIIECFKWSVLGTASVEPIRVLYIILVVGLVFISGVWFFAKAEERFVDSL